MVARGGILWAQGLCCPGWKGSEQKDSGWKGSVRVSVAESSSISVARTLLRALRAQGVRDVVYCPGSRSAPLAYALAEAEAAGELRCHVRLDERAAAFVAVGLSRAGALAEFSEGAEFTTNAVLGSNTAPGLDTVPGSNAAPRSNTAPRPVALMCTSGGAVAEFHAGVAEASHSFLPLIVVSADRPFEMRDVGASQTTTQVGIFGAHVRASWDVPAGIGAYGRLEALVARACAAAQGSPSGRPGPVHLNVGFRDPLVPESLRLGSTEPDASLRPSAPPALSPIGSASLSVPAALTSTADGTAGPQVLRAALVPLPWEQAVNPDLRTVIIAGDGADRQAASWAEMAGVPLLAEPSSNVTDSAAWVPHQQTLLTALDATLPDDSGSAEASSIASIEQVVVTGRPTLSRPVSALLARTDVRIIVVHPWEEWPDVAGQADVVCAALGAPQGPHADTAWLSSWRRASARVGQRLDERSAAQGAAAFPDGAHAMSTPAANTQPGSAQRSGAALSLLAVAETVWGSEDSTLLLGASNSVRAVDLVARGRGRTRVCANRGLAGIDGTIATALGMAWGSGEPVRVMLGDLAFFHDVSALSIAPGEPIPDVQIIVVDDQGGGIFASLEHGRPEYAQVFERWFGTPQQVSVQDLACAYGAAYRKVDNMADLRRMCRVRPSGIEVVHVRIQAPREELRWVKDCLVLP